MKRLFRVLFAAACVVCAGSLVLLLGYYRSGREGSQEYAGLIRRAVSIRKDAEQPDQQLDRNTDKNQQAEIKNPPALFVDFEELQSINEDIEAWIDFPGQNISYPVVQGEDNSHYLKYTFEGTRNGSGCIFADCRNEGLLTDDNTVIYGHNMRNGSMFGLLKSYLEQEHYKQFPYFDLDMPQGVYRCRIIAACRVLAREESYPTRFSTELERNQFIAGMKNQCPYAIDPDTAGEEVPLVPDGEAPLVMLSTCVGGGQYQYRFALLAEAVKVRE